MQIELERSLVDVEGAPVRAAAVAAGRLDLDHIGAQIGKHAAGEPAEPIRRVDDQDVRQQHGVTLSTPTFSVSSPRQAGTHIPETAVRGTMGPRFRGDDGTAIGAHTP